tara:strand:- start:54 stop:947 length:894 start_codon:yes stop_codon:yes gene_type:complete
MKFILLLIFITFNSIQSQDENQKFPKLDLRNFHGTITGLGINQDPNTLIPDRTKHDILLFDSQIDEIKLKAKNFNPSPLTDNNIVKLETNFGILQFKLHNNESPINCLNFKKLSNSGFYDNTLFHHSVPRFILQGGDILSRNHDSDDDGQGGPGWTVEAEYNNLSHKRGTLSMVRSSNDPNSAGSQFFISLSENQNLDNKYTIIGDLIEGEHILKRIVKIPSEHTQGKLLCKVSIPENENIDNWIKILDPVSNDFIYSKIPISDDRISYTETLKAMLNNLYRPGVPIIIDSIRVYSE